MDAILKTAIIAALKAGEEILVVYHDPASDFEIERKADNSPLTLADRRSHETIVDFLTPTPYPILSEEGKTYTFEERQKWETLWIVDPLDGTKEFIKRNGEFTVNIALVTNGIPILGVVYIPVKKELYYGTPETGAYKVSNVFYKYGMDFDNLQRHAMRLPEKKDHPSFIIVASRSHLSDETVAFIEKMRQQHESVEFTSIGSSIKICLVAEGSADVYPRFAPTMEWDTAAGHAVAKAAGMEIYQQDETTPLRYNKENLLNPWFIVKKEFKHYEHRS